MRRFDTVRSYLRRDEQSACLQQERQSVESLHLDKKEFAATSNAEWSRQR